MATITQPETTNKPSAASLTRERNRRFRRWIVYAMVYVILGGCAFLMLFPFLYMVTTSLKTATDVFRYPPQLLPYSPVMVEFEGQELPLYNVPYEGNTRQMVLVEESVRFGFFTTVDLVNSDEPRQSPIYTAGPG